MLPRYVDTFNKGGGVPANTFSSSGISQKPGGGPTAKFFVPTPMSSPSNEVVRPTGEYMQESNFINWSPTTFTENGSPSPGSNLLSGALKRNPSMGNLKAKLTPRSRRTVSWSGSFNEVPYDPDCAGYKTPGEASECSPHLFSSPGSSIHDDFQEVELK